MSNFYLPSTSASANSTPNDSLSPRQQSLDYDNYDDDDLDTLPYPKELARNDFLTPGFDAQTYLSSLRNRHQTLEDLRTDLRQRSQLLNQELLDLVNSNYEQFLSLGEDLKGGEEKVEGIRVGVLGFEREVAGIQKVLKDRLDETTELLETKKKLRQDVVFGRRLLEIDERIEVLEHHLGSKRGAKDDNDSDEDDGEFEKEDDDRSRLTRRLQRLQQYVSHFVIATQLTQRAGLEHPFVEAQITRLDQVRKNLLLDLSAALKEAKVSRQSDMILRILGLYAQLGARPNT